MTDAERLIVEAAFKVTVDADGFEHFERLPEASTRAIAKANDLLRKRERLLSRLFESAPKAGAFRVWHLLTIKKAGVHFVAAKDSPVEPYLTRPRPRGKKAKKRPRLTPVHREQRDAESRKTLAMRESKAVEKFKAIATAQLFDRLYSAALDGWPHR